MAERVQLSRRKGWRMPTNTVKVDRSTKWGNPFNWKQYPTHSRVHGDDDEPYRFSDAWRRELSVSDFEAAIKYDIGRPEGYPSNEEIKAQLAGKNLACWCPLGGKCHADVLLEIANASA